MGWLYMQSLSGFASPKAYLDDQFTYSSGGSTARMLRSEVVGGRVYYAAVEMLKPSEPRQVFALVCLVDHNPRDPEDYVFGYKDMSEDMGPIESDCPAAILDLLTPTTRQYALDWRARCRANAALRRTAA